MVEKLNPCLEEDDGTFWMQFDDFMKHFAALNVCKVPEEGEELRIKNRFVRVQEGDNLTNTVSSEHFYSFTINKRATVQIGAHQVDENCKGVRARRTYLDVGFAVF